MKTYFYDGVTYEGACYCLDCLKNIGIKTDYIGVIPIFAGSEWDSYPVCDICGKLFDYVSLINE